MTYICIALNANLTNATILAEDDAVIQVLNSKVVVESLTRLWYTKFIANLYVEFTATEDIGVWTSLFNIPILSKKETMAFLASKGSQLSGEGVYISQGGQTIASMNEIIHAGKYSLSLIFIPLL